jgi:Plasmid pRiA4b ORF-3-like protein
VHESLQRRFLGPWKDHRQKAKTAIVGCSEILQLAFGWSGFYLYEFRIHGRTFGDARSVCLADFQLHPGERFHYRYNFFVFWECDLRLEAILPHQGELAHPRCVGGRHPAPDEDDSGAWGYQHLQDHYKFPPLL